MKVVCPNCSRDIKADDINISEAIFMCNDCNEVFPLELKEDQFAVSPDFDLRSPPKGAWFKNDIDGTTVGASNRRLIASLIFLIPFTAVWSGFSMWGLYISQIVEGRFDPVRTLFGIPFLIGTITLVSMIMINLFGKVELNFSNGPCSVFTGVGIIGRRKEFFPEQIEGIYKKQAGSTNNKPLHQIVLERSKENGGDIKFGMLLSEDAFEYIHDACKQLIMEEKG